MIRNFLAALYALAVIGLIGSTCWAAGGMKGGREHSAGRVGLVLIAALQR